MQVTTIGLDLAKHWFQVHGVDANGQIVVRRKLRRSGVLAFFQSLPPCLYPVRPKTEEALHADALFCAGLELYGTAHRIA